MSEQILLLNPRPKRKRHHNRRRARRGGQPAGLRRYAATRRGTNPSRRRRRHSSRRRATNPRRHQRVMHMGRHYRRRNRRHHVRRSRRTNPRGMRLPAMGRGVLGGYIVPAAIGGFGGLMLDLAWGFLSPKLPPQVQTGYVGLAAKLGVVLAVAFGVNKFVPRLRSQTNRAAIGAGTVLAYGAIKGIAQSVLPATTPGLAGYIDYQSYALPGAGRLSGYMSQGMPRTLGSLEDLYSPAAVIQPPGTPVPRQFGGLRGYIAAQPHMASGGGLMGFDWQNDGM